MKGKIDMKKSECFRKAQIAVIKNQSFEAEEKIEILKVLVAEEDMQKIMEREDKENV